MISYNVFFSPRPGIDEQQVIASAKRLLDELRSAGKLNSYRILRVTDPASFKELPRFQVIIDYLSKEALEESLAFMRQPGRVKTGAHGAIVELVTDFKVSFTADA
jgi:hypothetical protein